MCSIDTALARIQYYVDEYLSVPDFSWDKYNFKKRSYQRWAAYEICNQIMDKPYEDSVVVVETFILEMTVYACYGKDEQCSFIFQNAIETAKDILSLLN